MSGEVDEGAAGAGRARPLARGVLSAGREPRWLNQGTLKGGVLAIAGVTVIAAPASTDVWTTVVGLLLVSWAALDVWARTSSADGFGAAPLVQVLALSVTGVVLIVPVELDITYVLGGVVVVFGVIEVVTALRGGAGHRRDRLEGGLLLLLVGGMAVWLPETVSLGIRAAFGTVGLVGGVVLIAAGLRTRSDEELERFDAASASAVATRWVERQRIGRARRATLTEALYFEPPNRVGKLASFWVMMVLATAIASFAIVQDSTAVVIGAMLVAPLMTPIMGAAAATVNGWLGRFGASMALAAGAAVAAVGVAWLIAAWLPSTGDLVSNSQITSRVEPSLLDLGIAVTAGAAGAYATVDSRVSSSLSGVAVAVALVPPLAVVGITIEAGRYEDASGAALLFLTNFVSILLVGSLVFALTGFANVPGSRDQQDRTRRVLRTALIAATLIVIPLGVTSQQVWTEGAMSGTVNEVVQDWAGDTELSTRVEISGEDITVVLEGAERAPDTDELQSELEAALDTPFDLEVLLVPTIVVHDSASGGD